jgi:hypothetical protein
MPSSVLQYAPAGPPPVAGSYGTGLTSLTATFTAQATADGSRLLAVVSVYVDSGTSEVPTFSDSGKHPWTVLKNQEYTSAQMREVIATSGPVKGQASHVVTITTTASSDLFLGAVEVDGLGSTFPTANGSAGSGTSSSTGACVPSATNGAAFVAGVSYFDTPGTLATVWPGSITTFTGTYDRAAVYIGGGSQNAGFTNTTTRGYACAIAAVEDYEEPAVPGLVRQAVQQRMG